jgi:glycosyltransferase involved in cell wall biosynthesis
LYPVAGPFLIPIIRDIIYLGFVRTLFDKIILEFSAAGISEYLESHSYFLRWVAKKIYNSDGAFQKSKFNPADAKYFNAKQIYYIPNGIPDEASTLHPIPRSKSLPVEILYIGIIRESKGVLILLEALAILRDRGKSVHGTFIGEFISNKAKRKIIKYISDNNLQTVVTLPGVKTGNDKWQYFMKSDIFCFPSFYENESFGIVIIEAMMFGLPVVSTDWRAIPGIVDNDVNGFLIPVKNPEALSEKLEILVENLELRNNMGKNGRKKFLNEYLLSIYLRRHEKAILEIIGAN